MTERFETEDVEVWRSDDLPREICLNVRGGDTLAWLIPAEAINLGNFLIKLGRKIMEEKQS